MPEVPRTSAIWEPIRRLFNTWGSCLLGGGGCRDCWCSLSQTGLSQALPCPRNGGSRPQGRRRERVGPIGSSTRSRGAASAHESRESGGVSGPSGRQGSRSWGAPPKASVPVTPPLVPLLGWLSVPLPSLGSSFPCRAQRGNGKARTARADSPAAPLGRGVEPAFDVVAPAVRPFERRGRSRCPPLRIVRCGVAVFRPAC